MGFTMFVSYVRFAFLMGMSLLIAGGHALGCSTTESNATTPPAPVTTYQANDQGRGVIRPPAASLQAFEVEEVGEADDTDWMMVPAAVEFRNTAMSAVTSPVVGRVQRIFVTEGQFVEEGAPLLEIQSAEIIELQASLEAAKTRFKQADDTLKRQQGLQADGVAVEADVMQAQTQWYEAKNDVARLRTTLKNIGSSSSKTVILHAPREGVILERKVLTGDATSPDGGPLMFVGDTHALWIVAHIFDGDLERVVSNGSVQVHMPGGLGKKTGKIIRIGEIVDRSLRRAPVWIEVDNTEGLRPGMMGQAAVQLRADSSLRLPPTAVLLTEDGTYRVWVEKEVGAFQARDVVVGQTRHGLVEVMGGLQPGERVVVQGALLLDSAASMRL